MILCPSDGNADQGNGTELRKGRAGEAVVAEERKAEIAEQEGMEEHKSLGPTFREPRVACQSVILPREEQADRDVVEVGPKQEPPRGQPPHEAVGKKIERFARKCFYKTIYALFL